MSETDGIVEALRDTTISNGSTETKSSYARVNERLKSPQKEFGPPVIIARGVSKRFVLAGREEPVTALKNVTLSDEDGFPPIRSGEFVMIRGPSGGGKTTLLNILGTLDDPTDGSVEIFGETVDSQSSDAFLADLRLRRIGFVFQTFNLLATMSAFENVQLPMIIMGKLTPLQTKRRALFLLDMVGLQDRYTHLPSELSGGEQQRVTIARALANEPQLLLLDEPTGDLDTLNTVEIMNIILRINLEQKTTCLMVTHNPDLECYADRILYVQDGTFYKQAVNKTQVALNFDAYIKFLNSQAQ